MIMASNDENKRYLILIRLILVIIVAILLSIGSLSRISNHQTEQDQLEQELSDLEGKLVNYFITSIEGSDLANAYNNTEDPSNSYTKRIISEMKQDLIDIKDNLVYIRNKKSQGAKVDEYISNKYFFMMLYHIT